MTDALGPHALDGRVAVVTGGTGGIGRATCYALLVRGARVVVVGRSPGRAAEVRRALLAAVPLTSPAAVLDLTLDVRSEADMQTMAARTLERFGRIDILVTCAGLGGPRRAHGGLPLPAHQLAPEDWDEVVDTNLRGVFLSNRAVLPAMMAQRCGEIVNVASARGGTEGRPYASAYCASKFGVVGLTESLAEEVYRFGIRVQALLPDAVATPLLEGTTLGAGGTALRPETVAEFIVTMLTLPPGVALRNPILTAITVGGLRRLQVRRAAYEGSA